MNRRRRRKKHNLILIKIIILIILLLSCFKIVKTTYAKYQSTATSEATMDLAYYLLNETSISQDLKVASILPSASAYTYDIYVANYRDDERTETALEYTIILKTTTNLPLIYAMYKDGNTQTNLISSTNTRTEADSYGTYFTYITIEPGTLGFDTNESHTYTLSISFPTSYNDSSYEGIIEYIQVTVNAGQITS